MTRGERRDFVLDSGAVSSLAGDDTLLVGYRKLLEGPILGSLHIPSPVLTEIHTGTAKYDALVDRMVNRISGPNAEVYITSGLETDMRAGELRPNASGEGVETLGQGLGPLARDGPYIFGSPIRDPELLHVPTLLISSAPPRHGRKLTSIHNVCTHHGARLAIA